MSTFITALEPTGTGTRLAVKDAIDVAGVVTTVGSPAVANHRGVPTADAVCMAGARAAGVRILGKTNCTELCRAPDGINPWYGTPRNPIDPARIPGGSSSGSAVAVATGEADVAFGTDTGGSIRIPAACCGVMGLKTTWGLISTDGVFPFAPIMDVVGPMARTMYNLVLGMQLLEPGFAAGSEVPTVIGRVRLPADPAVDEPVDVVLRKAGFEVREVQLPRWDDAEWAATMFRRREGLESQGWLLRWEKELSPEIAHSIRRGEDVSREQRVLAAAVREKWRDDLVAALREVDLLALPTLAVLPPLLEESRKLQLLTTPINLAGVPALALPIPGKEFPASLQLVGPMGGEEALLAAGRYLDQAGLLWRFLDV